MTFFKPAILYVDDEKTNLETFKRAFGADYLVKTCLSAQEAMDLVQKEHFPLVIVDQRMPGMTGIDLCERLIALSPHSIRMILTAYTETQMLLDAMNRGHVHDYLVKPWRKSELQPVIEKAFDAYKERVVKLKELEARLEKSEQRQKESEGVFDVDGLIGSSTGLAPVVEILKKAAPTEATVLILGETGTGKELIARSVHQWSERKNAPFVVVHCAAMSRGLLESELFGHEKGAFTGASDAREGRFEMAEGGTVFLDEIGEIDDAIQVKLLRVLQQKSIERVGGNKTIPVNVRIVAATNKDLTEEVKRGNFRPDLFFRLNVIQVNVPPLRERSEDIPYLANYFLDKFNHQLGRHLEMSAAAMELLTQYDWPGNVRELQNILERAVILSSGPQIEKIDLQFSLTEGLSVNNVSYEMMVNPPSKLRDEIQAQEIKELTSTLRKAHGNIAEAARLLGVARSTLFYRLKRCGLI